MPVSKPVSKPVPTEHENKGDPADPTAALPVMRSEADDSDAATKKLNALGTSDSQGDNGDAARPHRRGASGGLSAQDLLRREGRL
jgi:RND superfamily putative drug exporter